MQQRVISTWPSGRIFRKYSGTWDDQISQGKEMDFWSCVFSSATNVVSCIRMCHSSCFPIGFRINEIHSRCSINDTNFGASTREWPIHTCWDRYLSRSETHISAKEFSYAVTWSESDLCASLQYWYKQKYHYISNGHRPLYIVVIIIWCNVRNVIMMICLFSCMLHNNVRPQENDIIGLSRWSS